MLGTDFYHILQWFLIYSVLGWIVESIYMSFCNKKLTNRGFVKGPICPIYGVGALLVYFILEPYSHSILKLYIYGCILATLLEYLTARLMQFVFGEVWWDYSEKPYNYRGILCLESSIAWGFYTVGLFVFLKSFVDRVVASYSFETGRKLGVFIVSIFVMDFLWSIHRVRK